MITSIRGQNLEDYVDSYFLVDMLKSAYEEVILALPDKSQWPESQHGFFMHPPLLKSTSKRRKTQRHKDSAEGGQGVEKGGTSVQFASNMDTTGGPAKMVIQKTKLPCLQPGIIKLHNSCILYLYFL